MKVRFYGQKYGVWAPVLAEVESEAELGKLSQVRGGVAAIEHRTVWEGTGLPTGVMDNFCLTFNCDVCGGRTA
jgi:hypothetical protein